MNNNHPRPTNLPVWDTPNRDTENANSPPEERAI